MATDGTTAPPGSADPRIARALEEMRTLLIPGERIEAYAVQRRLFALTHRRILVAATTGRLIAMTRGLLGGFHPQDVRWQDLRDARLNVGILAASLIINSLASPDLASEDEATRTIAFAGLGKSGAEDVYRQCQAQEQAWREKRRVRDLEELRARSGGIQFGAGPAAPAAPSPAGPEGADPVARLARAKEMLDKGLISDAEYESIKARIVTGL